MPTTRSLATLKVLVAVAEDLNRHTDVASMLESALPLVLRLTGLKAGRISLLDEEGRFTLAAAHNLPPALAAEDKAALRWTLCECQRELLGGRLTEAVNMVKCARLRRIRDSLRGARARALAEQTGGFDFHVSVPLRADRRLIGIMNTAKSGARRPDRQELALLTLVAQ
jgi:GAF domain-containing protein